MVQVQVDTVRQLNEYASQGVHVITSECKVKVRKFRKANGVLEMQDSSGAWDAVAPNARLYFGMDRDYPLFLHV